MQKPQRVGETTEDMRNNLKVAGSNPPYLGSKIPINKSISRKLHECKGVGPHMIWLNLRMVGKWA